MTDRSDDIRTKSEPLPAVRATGLCVVRDGRTILDAVSATIPAGQCTAILGPNGCGKTSFTRAITGHLHPTAGAVEVFGQTIGATDVWALRRRIAVVSPAADAAGHHEAGSVVDADLSALDATLTGYFGTVGLYDTPTAEQRDHAAFAMQRVGLAGHEHQRFGALSTGEKRRCLIARALVRRPELLILDEPTAGLDVRGREQVLATIETILAKPQSEAGVTVLMITHHVEELSPRTAQVMLMRAGRFMHVGPPREVITPESLSATFDCKLFVRRIHGRYWLEVLPEAWLDLV